MAAPATHIIFADAFLQSGAQFSRADFIIGTSFPDIRHLGSITREASHLQPADLVHVRGERDSFVAGMRFHNYIDLARTAYWQQTGILEQLPQTPHLQQALKLREDIILYDHVPDWRQIIEYFDVVPDAKHMLGVPATDTQHWHRIIAEYIASRPTLDSALRFKSQFKTPPTQQQIRDMIESAKLLDTVAGLDDAIHQLYNRLTRDFTAQQESGQPLLNLVE